MKNDFIAIILAHSLAWSESSFELNDELITEIEWNDRGVQGVTNDPIFGVAISESDMWVGMTGFVVGLMTSIYLRCNTNIILYDGKIERIWWQCNQRLIIFINNALSLHFFQACLNWPLIPVWCTCIVKISDNFIYCHIFSNIWVSIMWILKKSL